MQVYLTFEAKFPFLKWKTRKANVPKIHTVEKVIFFEQSVNFLERTNCPLSL